MWCCGETWKCYYYCVCHQPDLVIVMVPETVKSFCLFSNYLIYLFRHRLENYLAPRYELEINNSYHLSCGPLL